MFLKMSNENNSEEKIKYAPVVQHIKSMYKKYTIILIVILNNFIKPSLYSKNVNP